MTFGYWVTGVGRVWVLVLVGGAKGCVRQKGNCWQSAPTESWALNGLKPRLWCTFSGSFWGGQEQYWHGLWQLLHPLPNMSRCEHEEVEAICKRTTHYVTFSPIQTSRMQQCAKTFDNKLRIITDFLKMSCMGTEWLVLAKVRHILPEIVTISPIQTFSMQKCATTFNNKFQFLEDFRNMTPMGTELLVLAVWVHKVPLDRMHRRPSAGQKGNC